MKEELRGHRTIAAIKSRRRADPGFHRGMQRSRIWDQAGVIRTSKATLAIRAAVSRLVADRLVLPLEGLLDRLGPRPRSPGSTGSVREPPGSTGSEQSVR